MLKELFRTRNGSTPKYELKIRTKNTGNIDYTPNQDQYGSIEIPLTFCTNWNSVFYFQINLKFISCANQIYKFNTLNNKRNSQSFEWIKIGS